MKFRIFYAPDAFKTWEKVFLLLSDGRLYCKYLDNFNDSYIKEQNINYENFVAEDYSWGTGVEGDRGVAFSNYQGCRKELTWDEYTKLTPSKIISSYGSSAFTRQIKWVETHLNSIGLSKGDWDKEIYDRLGITSH